LYRNTARGFEKKARMWAIRGMDESELKEFVRSHTLKKEADDGRPAGAPYKGWENEVKEAETKLEKSRRMRKP